MTKTDGSWWPLAERRGISREVWGLLVADNLPSEAKLGEGVRPPEWAVGSVRNVVLPDDIWDRMIKPMEPYALDAEALREPHLSQSAPGLALFAEILTEPTEKPIRDRVAGLIRWYDYAIRNEYPIHILRERIKRQITAIEITLNSIPEERNSETFFVRNIFTLNNEILNSNIPIEEKSRLDLLDLWDNQFGSDQIRLSLLIYRKNLIRTLNALPSRRPPATAIDDFVGGLAIIWQDCTGSIPTGGNRNTPDGTKFGGAFSDFVRAVVREIGPPEPSLDRPLKKVVRRMNSGRK